MTDSPIVTVAWPAIRRRLEANDYAGVYLVAALNGVKGCPPEVLADVRDAVEQANTAMEDAEGRETVWSAPPAPSPAGAVMNLDWAGEGADTQMWLQHLASALALKGRSGAIKAAPRKSVSVSNEYLSRPQPVAYLAYTLEDPIAPLSNQSWRVEAGKTAEILRETVAWAEIPDAQVYFHESAFTMILDPADVTGMLATAIGRSLLAGVTYVARKPTRMRNLSLAANGEVALNDNDDNNRWEEHIPRLRDALLRDPAALDIGIIRGSTNGYASSWTSIDDSPVRLPYLRSQVAWQSNRHMWSRYVPDAHAIQVLTAAHLDKARDLTSWQVTRLPGERYLVEARDFAAWMDNGGEVAQDVLERARSDFGEMIITREAIDADPYGWLGGPRPPERA